MSASNTDGFRLVVEGPDYEGFVVVDSIMDGRSAGGVRITHDLGVDEVSALAGEMTRKFAFFHLPRGGAKAGVRMAAKLDRDARLRALTDFGTKLAPILRNGIYSPGMDMNCGPDELRAIYRGAGIELGALTDTSLYTAMTIHHALRATASHLGIEGRPVTLAVEGFGSVARHLAARLDSREFEIVALATIEGGLRAEQAFSLDEVLRAKERFGDGLVREMDGDRIEPHEVLVAQADIVLPSSRTWVITSERADAMRTLAVVPISNVPYAEGAVDRLHDRGILVLPGFVTNVGGVLASSLHDLGVGDEEIERLLARWYRSIVDGVLDVAADGGRPATEIAELIAREHSRHRPAFLDRSLARRVHERFIRPRLPQAWRVNRARQDFTDRSRRILEELAPQERQENQP